MYITTLRGYRDSWTSTENERGPYITPPAFAAGVRVAQSALAEFKSGRQAFAIDRAVAEWEHILVDPTFNDAPISFCLAALNNAANAYLLRCRSGDLDTAVELADRAVGYLQLNSPDRADYINFLMVTLLDRYRQTLRIDDLERSIRLGRELIDFPPPDPRDLADIQNSFGNSLMERYERILRLDDLEGAICAYQRAINEIRVEAPNYRIYINNLSEALGQLSRRTGSLDHLESAIKVSEQALAASQNDAVWHPKASVNLANVLLDRVERSYEQHDADDLQRAVELLRSAKTAFPPGSAEHAVVANALGGAALLEFRRTGEVSVLDEEVLRMEEAARSVPPHSPDALPILYNTGAAFHTRYGKTHAPFDLRKCIEYWERTCISVHGMFASVPVDYKFGHQQKFLGVQRQLVLAYLEHAKADPSQAVAAKRRAMLMTEEWKARLLVELIGRGNIPVPPAIATQAIREKELLAELNILDNEDVARLGGRQSTGVLERLQRRERCRVELERLWWSMSRQGPAAEDYVAVRRAGRLNWTDLSELATGLGPDTVLISHLVAFDRTLLFILRAGWDEPEVVEIRIDEDAGAKLMRELIRNVYTEPDSSPVAVESWGKALLPLLEQATRHLAGAARVVFVPGGSGYLIPWATLTERAGWRQSDGSPIPLVNIPSLTVLKLVRRRSTSGKGRPMVVGDPQDNMYFGVAEADAIAAMLDVTPLIGRRADKVTVLNRLPDASIAHLAAHAYFVPGAPLDAGVRLADQDLTARDLMGCALQADLIVLSCCDTGRTEVLGGDEVAGLTMALLQAGARSVLVSLWPVSGAATAVLMSSFYEAWEQLGDKAAALKTAQAKVRMYGWSHPHHWSAFVLYGDWARVSQRRIGKLAHDL
jgi:tetratricopeptide (TPR) repeat protein